MKKEFKKQIRGLEDWGITWPNLFTWTILISILYRIDPDLKWPCTLAILVFGIGTVALMYFSAEIRKEKNESQ